MVFNSKIKYCFRFRYALISVVKNILNDEEFFIGFSKNKFDKQVVRVVYFSYFQQ